MESLAENLTPPYYAATLNERQDDLRDKNHIAPTDEMVTLATRQPGFLGLESSRDQKGIHKTVSYWKDVDAIEEWITVGDKKITHRFGIGLDETCGIEVSLIEENAHPKKDRGAIKGLNAFVAAAISSLTGLVS
jgi:heme-degrading monooxygenase HmoA